MEQPKKDLYKRLNSDGVYTKSYEEFEQQFSSPERQEKLYQKLNADGKYTKSKEEFVGRFFSEPVKKKVGTDVGVLPSTTQKQSGELEPTNGSLATQKISQADLDNLNNLPKQKSIIPELPKNLKKVIDNPENYVGKVPKKETRGFGGEVVAKLAKGSSQLGADIASIPELVYDVFAIPQNAVADIFDAPSLKTDSKKFEETIGVKNQVKEFYKNEVSKLKQESDLVDKKYQFGVTDSFINGDYENGFRQLTNSFAESLPATTSIMVGGAYTKAPKLLLASTMMFGAGKNEQLKDENPEMNANTRIANALASGLAEGAFETIGSGTIGASARALVEREGKQKAFSIMKDGLQNFYKESLKKNPLTASVTGEGIEEWATQVTQNAIDVATGVKPSDYNVFTGGADAFIGGAFGGAVFGAGLKGLDKIVTSKDNDKVKANLKASFALQEQLENPEISPIVKSEIEKKINAIVKENQDIVNLSVDKVNGLDEKVKAKLIESVDKMSEIKTKAEEIKADLNTPESVKRILLEELKNEYKTASETKNSILEGSTSVVDVLPIKEQDKIKRQALKELTSELNPDGTKNITIGDDQISKRAVEIYNNEIKSKQNEQIQTTTTENQQTPQPQAEVQETKQEVLTNETASPSNIVADGNISVGNEPMGEMGVEQKPTAEIVTEESIQSANDVRPIEGETEVDYALNQIDKGVLTWNGDIMSPRIDLGMSWADIRKGEADLKRGKVDSVPAKRLIESLSNAKKEGGYRYKLGTGGANMRSSEFVSFEDMQRLENEYQLTDSELEEINTNQEQLAKEYDDYINSLDEETQNEILENYEAEIDNRAEVGENPQSRKSEKNVSDEKTSRKQQRKKIAEATIDDFANALKDLLPKANTEGVKTQGLSQDDIIDFIAKNAKLLANTGIEIDEAIRQVIAKLKDNFEDFDVKIEDVKAKLEPNKEVVETQKERDDIFAEEIFNKPNLEKISGNFEEMAFNFPNTGEVGTYLSGKTIEKYTKESPENNQEIFKIKLVDSLKHGIDVVQLAFEKFGDDFVGKTLDFINSNALPLESKALLMISLENELNRQKTLRPEDKNLLQKQLNLVRIKRQAFARSNSLALNMNKLQKFAEIGFDVNEITDKMFSPSEKETRKKIENAIESNINEINIEEEIQDEDFEITPPLSKRNKADVKKDISDALLKMKADLNKVSRGGTLSVTIPYYKQLEAVTPHILKLAKLYSELGGMKTKEIIDEIYSQISESFPSLKRKDVVDVIKENQEKKQPKKDKKIKDLVKQALINKGYFREVNKKQSDGTTEVVKFLDWKKLAGEEGSIENIKNKTESALKEIGYTESQIESMQKALIEEYNDLRANIIEKSLNELESRNRIKPSVNRKTISKRLAELYNYGIFNEDMDKYSNLLNSAIGFNEFEQKQFEKLKEYGKALSVLFSFENKNNKGNKFSELAIKTQANIINHEIKNLLSVASFMEGNKMYKFTSVLRDYAGLSQRAKLLSLKQVLENPFSGFIERMFQKAGDAFYQKEDGKLVANRKKLAKMIYSDITLKGGLFYGEVTSSLTSQTKVEDWLNKRSENEIYHLLLTNMTGRSYLEGADSMNKALITEKIFHKNLVSLLTNKTNPIGQMSKQEAMNYVAESLTGQNFEDAKKLAEEAIDKVNNESGKNILPKTPQNIIRFANDIVKESLLQGNKLDIESIEKSYNSAYKSAGLTIGHEANNIISKGAGMLNARVEVALEKAIKEKKWNEATILTLESILTKNIINPFVGGGFNWLFLTLQKAGMDPISLISDFAKYRNNKIDMTTEEGIKNLENALVRATNLRYTASRTFIGAVISIAMATALISSGADDDLDEWLKENEWARKYSKVILPTVITLILSAKNEELGKGLQDLLNIKSDNFNETLSVLKSVDSENKSLPGEIGRVSGKYFDTPIPWRLVKDVDNIKRGLNGIPEYKSVYKVNGFLNGVYQGGFVDYVGLRPSDTEDEYKTEDEKRKESKFSYPKMPSLPRPPRP